MIITTTLTMKNNIFKGVVTTEPDSLDLKYLDQFSEPSIDTVGTIPMGEGSFDIEGGPAYKKVVSGMPIEFTLSGNTDAEAQDKVTAWLAEMSARISAEMTDLKTPPLPTSPAVAYYTA